MKAMIKKAIGLDVSGPPHSADYIDPKMIDKAKVVVSGSPLGNDILVHCSIRDNSEQERKARTPLDVCCVVDTSGSMDAEGSIKNDAGKTEAFGLSVLDIVKHAVKTITESLGEGDQLALVTFESHPHVIQELGPVDDKSKGKILEKINAWNPSGGTDLWRGLEAGMELLRERSKPGRYPVLLVLTDGQPDYNPDKKLAEYKVKRERLPIMSTFGFGNAVDTPMLINIANEGRGMHCFIPDSSFVGTAFVNLLSNLMVSYGVKASLIVTPKNGAKIDKVHGYPVTDHDGEKVVEMCTLQAGQSKDLVLRVAPPQGFKLEDGVDKLVSVKLVYENALTRETVDNSQVEFKHLEDDEVQYLRLLLVTALTGLATASTTKEYLQILADAEGRLKEITEQEQKDQPQQGDKGTYAGGLLKDIEGQVREALLDKYYSKWGRHYLPSLARAHLLQQSNNFKDFGIQFYGSPLFEKLRTTCEDTFIKIPAPKPTKRAPSGQTYQPVNMRAYYNASGGCIAGECKVTMQNGSERRIDSLRKGDVVATPNGEGAEVVCVVAHRTGGKRDLVSFPGGLRITPYHPVRFQNIWKFPVEVGKLEKEVACDVVYNFVLSNSHVMTINDVECVTLGHGMQEDVVAHAYFGTQKVVEELSKMKGWKEGKVEMIPQEQGAKCEIRDAKTGLVCGFVSGVDGVVVGRRDV